MDKKKIKELLKTANKFVAEKNYKEALQTCKEILAADDKNYMCLVFLGVSQEGLLDFPAAFQTYQDAVKVDPDQNLAWQGLSKLYDKVEDGLGSSNAEYFIKVFEKLLDSCKNDEEKKLSYETRLCKLYSTTGRFDSSFELIGEVAPAHRGNLFASMLEGGKVKITLPDDSGQLDILKEVSKEVANSSNQKEDTRKTAWTTHLKCLVRLGATTEMLWDAVNVEGVLRSRYSEKLMLRIYLDTYPERSDKFKGSEVISYVESDHELFCTLKSLELMEAGDLKEARDTFYDAYLKDKSSISNHLLHSDCLLRLHCCKESIAVAKRGLDLNEAEVSSFYGDRQKVKDKFELLVAKNGAQLNEEDAWEEANEIIAKLETGVYVSPLDILTTKIFLALKMEDRDRLENLSREIHSKCDELSSVASTNEMFDLNLCLGLLAAKEGDYAGARNYFENSIGIRATDPRGHMQMGLLEVIEVKGQLGDAEEKKGKKFIECMSKAIQSCPSHPLPYYFIGCYLSKLPDGKTNKSTQFLMKAFNLDGNDDRLIAKDLVDHLLKINDQENLGHYLNLIFERTKTKCPKWVLLRLGAYHLKRGNVEEAIVQLQAAVVKDTKDLRAWERLGEAYLKRGSYTSALKAFNKVITCDPDAIYSLYQIACIQHKLGQFEEATEKMEQVIRWDSNYIPALFKIGEIGLESARRHSSKCIHGRAVLSLQSSIHSLAKVCKMRPESLCVWKCLGDVFSEFGRIPEERACEVSLPEEFKMEGEVTRLALLLLGEKCYSVCLKLQPKESNHWHDLGLNLHLQVKVQSSDLRPSLALSSALASTARKSFQCLQRASTLRPSDPTHWNALGVVASSKPLRNHAIGQHCFIKSIECGGGDVKVVAWANLGFLYLMNGECKLAHEAFKTAQSIEPTFAPSWIGQALVAEELTKSGVVDRLEAMDLFRHSVEIDNHPEASIGYAHWVCTTMDEFNKNNNIGNIGNKNIGINSHKYWLEFTFKHLNAIDSALDAMAKYTASRPECIKGWNYFGLLCERQKLNITATEAFERCMTLLNEEDADYKLHKRIILTNYARLLCKTGKYDSSQKHYDDLFDLLKSDFEDDDSLVEICHMALSHFKNKDYERSFEFYDIALQVTEFGEDEERHLDEVHLSMGTCLMMMGKADDAKHFILKGIGNPKGTLDEVLCSLLCVGLLQKELPLINVVLNEMHNNCGRSVAARSSNLAFLSSRAKFLLSKSKDVRSSVRDFLRAIHLRPDQSESWVRAAMFLLTGDHVTDDVIKNVRSLCEAAISKEDKSCYQEALQCLAIISLKTSPTTTTTTTSSDGDDRNKMVPSFSLAQKLVRLYPDQLTNWCILLASCQQQIVAKQLEVGNKVDQELMTFALMTSKRVMDQVESTYDLDNPYLKDMHRWLSRQHALALINAGLNAEAESFLQKVSWQYDDDHLLTSLVSFINNDVEQLLLGGDSKENISKMVAGLVLQERNRNVKLELFENHVEKTSWFNQNPKLRNLIRNCLQ